MYLCGSLMQLYILCFCVHQLLDAVSFIDIILMFFLPIILTIF